VAASTLSLDVAAFSKIARDLTSKSISSFVLQNEIALASELRRGFPVHCTTLEPTRQLTQALVGKEFSPLYLYPPFRSLDRLATAEGKGTYPLTPSKLPPVSGLHLS
jgi:hypothetical protein